MKIKTSQKFLLINYEIWKISSIENESDDSMCKAYRIMILKELAPIPLDFFKIMEILVQLEKLIFLIIILKFNCFMMVSIKSSVI